MSRCTFLRQLPYLGFMGSHPINLAVRFLLELTVLGVMGYWGWKYSSGWMRWAMAIGIPVLMAAAWAVFAVPGDPSRSGEAPIITPGAIRLLLEIGFFAAAVWALFDLQYPKAGYVFSAIIIVHYVLSWDRIAWLLGH